MGGSSSTGESPTHEAADAADLEQVAQPEQLQAPGSLGLDADMMNVHDEEDDDDSNKVLVNPNILMELNPKMSEMWARGRLSDYEATRILEMIVEYYYMRFGIFDPFMVATLLVAMSIGRNGEGRKEFVSVAAAMAGGGAPGGGASAAVQASTPTRKRGALASLILGPGND